MPTPGQNPWDKATEIAKQDGMPRMIFSCGTADVVIYKHFITFRTYAYEIGLKAEFTEREGYNHEWRFWEKEIQRAIDIFLLGDEKAGVAKVIRLSEAYAALLPASGPLP